MRVSWLASLLVLTAVPIYAHAEGGGAAANATTTPPADTANAAATQSSDTANATATSAGNAASASATAPKLACAPVKVHFALDSDQLYDSEKPLLDKTADCLKNNGSQRISIVGNADDRGPSDYNRDLAQRRADTVARYLQNKGAEQAQIESVISHGEDSPICREDNLKCWQLNRRTAIRQSCHL